MQIQVELSDREHEIIRLLADGLKNQEIADRTGLTLYTVKWYLKEIYSKLHVGNRTQAVARARSLDLLDGDRKPSRIRANLPNMLVPIVGRQREAEALRELLLDDTSRLVTLCGLGGMGKTTLALDVGHHLLAAFSDGVFFVSLAQSNGQIYTDIARTLNYESGKDVESLAAFLYDKHILLILDNFESFIGDYAGDLALLLQATKHLRILVTSRERLNLQSEVLFTLDGLSVTTSADEQSNPAYALFVQRVRANVGAFDPTPDEATQINAICRLLHGMPLAIEMAAKWASILPLQDTYTQLSAGLDLLAIDEKDRPARHQSVRVTFDYSFRLLPEETRTILVKLGVFAPDGFTLPAAQAVTGVTPQRMKQLFDHALIQRSDARFILHPLIRQYLIEKLEQNAEVKQQTQTAHRAYYLNFIMECLYRNRDTLDPEVTTLLLAERQNIVRAWRQTLDEERFSELIPVVDVGGLYDVAEATLDADQLFAETLDKLPSNETILRGRLLAYRTIFLWRTNDVERTLQLAQETEQLLLNTPYVRDVALVLCHVAMVENTVFRQLDRCMATIDRAERLFDESDCIEDGYTKFILRCARPAALYYAGKYAEALPLLETMPVPSWQTIRLFLPEALIHLGRSEEARRVLKEQQQVAYVYGKRRLAIGSTVFLAILDNDEENLPSAVTDALVAAVRDRMDYPSMSVFHWALSLLVSGQEHWSRLVLNGNIHALHRFGETFLMYQAVLQAVEALQMFQLAGSDILLKTLLADPDCPSEIQQLAKYKYPQAAATPSQSEVKLLDAVTKVLLKDLAL